jgi:hypothetical protein
MFAGDIYKSKRKYVNLDIMFYIYRRVYFTSKMSIDIAHAHIKIAMKGLDQPLFANKCILREGRERDKIIST